MARTKTSHLYYIPGIISLTILPFLFYYYGSSFKKVLNQGAIQVFWYDPELSKKHPEIFSGTYPPERKYIDISLTGNRHEDSIKLNFSQVRLREILISNDSVNGIHYQFGDSAQYWSVVRVLDICQIEQARTYMPYENNLWVYHIPPDTASQNIIEPLICGTTYTDITPKPSWLSAISGKAQLLWQTSWPLLVGFLVLAWFSVRTLYKLWSNGR